MQLTERNIFVGIDVHKYTHTASALNCFGQSLGYHTFSNTTFDQFLTWLSSLSEQPNIIIGIEDINGYGLHLGKQLVSSDYQTFYVPPILTDRERRSTTHRIKTDQADADRVARVMLTKSEQTVPANCIVLQDQTIRELDLLLQERGSLVSLQTALKNQLHALLHQQYGDGYKHSFKNCFTRQAMNWYQDDLKDDSGNLSGSILRRIDQLILIREQCAAIDEVIRGITKSHRGIQSLIKIPGCGIDSAARIVVEIGSISRFSKKSKLARYAGLAPVERSSGAKTRLHMDHAGNRSLNRAIHRIALTQISRYGGEESKDFYLKKQKEGKSKLWAMRCLKRHIANRIFVTLKQVA